jgi:hypothetical protein
MKSAGQSDQETVWPERLGCCAIRRDEPATDVRELASVNADNASQSSPFVFANDSASECGFSHLWALCVSSSQSRLSGNATYMVR